LFEDVPPSEHDVVQVGQRYEVLDFRSASFGPFAEPNRPHLRQRTDRRRQPFPDGQDAGNRRRADRAQTDEQHAEFAARRSNVEWWSHNRPLYHEEMRMFLRKPVQSRDPLPVTMAGVRMGERILQVGFHDPQLTAVLAAKPGLSGSVAIAVSDEEHAAR